jgi:FkbM family methyltransferase
VVFDVGANVGDWTAEVLHAASEARVHSFELVPETAMRLSDRFRHNPRVTVVATGLSDEDATVPVKHYPGHTTVSGITDFPHPYDHEWLDAAVVRGDDYCAVHGIDHIDYLKIDAEGSDHRVLAGFEKMLKAGRIDAIQFEYGQANISARFLLADYHALLGDTGYVVGKLYPDHVEFRGYKLADEDFIGPNIVAVRSDRAELLALLN